jgi:hypothetical protein
MSAAVVARRAATPPDLSIPESPGGQSIPWTLCSASIPVDKGTQRRRQRGSNRVELVEQKLCLGNHCIGPYDTYAKNSDFSSIFRWSYRITFIKISSRLAGPPAGPARRAAPGGHPTVRTIPPSLNPTVRTSGSTLPSQKWH